VKKVAFSTPMLICLLAALAFSQSISDSDPFVKLNPSGPQTITSGPLNIIAAPDNPGLQCNLCLRDVSTPTWNGGSEFESFSHSAIVGNFAHHLFANYWAPPDGAEVGNFYPFYVSTEADGNATWATYVGAQFDSGNGGGLRGIYNNWEGLHVQMTNVVDSNSGVTVPGHLYGLSIQMPGIVGGLTSAGVRVGGLPDPSNLAFFTRRGTFRTENGDIVAHSGTVQGRIIQVNHAATWTAGDGEPTPDSCVSFGSLYSRTDGPDASHTLYVCTREGWVAK